MFRKILFIILITIFTIHFQTIKCEKTVSRYCEFYKHDGTCVNSEDKIIKNLNQKPKPLMKLKNKPKYTEAAETEETFFFKNLFG
ncbi:hypothetical protein CVS40_3252 [Lucilia cuprina]|nr:hypothetical protein CVS40_3252 [Lucilia cuprina]